MPAHSTPDPLLDAFHRIVEQRRGEGDTDLLIRAIVEEARRVLGCDAATLFLYDPPTQTLSASVVVGGSDEVLGVPVPLGAGIVGAAAEERRTILVNDAATDDRHLVLDERYKARNLAAAPLLGGGALLGVLEVLNRATPFDERESRVLEIIAAQAGLHLQVAQLVHEGIAQSRLAAIGATAAGIAHYIRNIQAQLQGSSRLVELALERGDLDTVRKTWPLFSRGNARVMGLVTDILELTRERTLRLDPTDLRTLVDEVCEGCAALAAEAGVALTVDERAQLPTSMVDQAIVRDALSELVINALAALRTGGTGAVQVVLDRDGDRAVLQVVDDGPGLPADVQRRMFEPFFTTRVGHSTGLGLALARKTLGELGATIEATPNAGSGACLTIRLPLIQAHASP